MVSPFAQGISSENNVGDRVRTFRCLHPLSVGSSGDSRIVAVGFHAGSRSLKTRGGVRFLLDGRLAPASLFESLTVRAGPQGWNSEKKECLAFPILVQEKVTILSCLVSAFSPPLFSPRLGRFFRFFNESLHESCNRIKDILSSRSVCLMPSIESIGAISSLGGRAIDSSCPWLVKGMRQGSQSPQQRDRAILPNSGTIESLKLRNYRISQELNKLFYASGIGKHDKSVLHILASSLVFKERKLQRLTEEKGPISSASASSLLGRDTFIDFFSFFLGLQAKGRTACPTSRIEAYPPTSLPWEFRTSSKPFLALSNVLGEGSAGESPIDPIFLIAPHSSRPGTKKSLRWADANLDLSTEQFHSSRSLNPIFNESLRRV
ncbi:hypothetical protein Tco_0986546 [Tanacetum coccineum]